MVKAAPIHSSPDEIIQHIFQITFLLCWGYYMVHRQRGWHCLLFTTGQKEEHEITTFNFKHDLLAPAPYANIQMF